MAIDLTTYSDLDLEALRIQVLTEVENRKIIANAKKQVDTLNNLYSAAIANKPAADGSTVPTNGWGPGEHVLFRGTEYINQSGAWLSVGPDKYSMGWKLASPPPVDTVAAWAASTAYKVGDKVSYNSVVYKCLQAHTSQTDWKPSNVPALWAVA